MRLPILLSAFALSACVNTILPETNGRIDNLAEFQATAGNRVVTNQNTRIWVSKGGSFNGVTHGNRVKGNWDWQNGFWCRQITEPVVSDVDCQAWYMRGPYATVRRDQGTGEALYFKVDRYDY
ncbi:hypothetical protein [Qingshengfaniella alkalisoli]|uniref:Lipoprotein n=1 Tax=Qingshengfaniella alkalisoli TaxID=2599296 RepID=A0A5B8IWE9_9RHOB|nr:hypothetical protein [Qingshengfaniella alkalisoli]QDY69843.1 hypothetical protein FPZ52_09570 [Qingshengfaniella alkalisoli]